MRWLSAVPIVAFSVGMGVSYSTLNSPDQLAREVFQARYADVRAGKKDVNGDGEYEYVLSFRNPDTRLQEERILQFRNGQPVLRKYEVKDGKIIFLE